MLFEICVGCAPFTTRPNVRLLEIISKYPEIELFKQWKIGEQDTTCRSFGDWYWTVEASQDHNTNQNILKIILDEMKNFNSQGRIRFGSIKLNN